MGWYVATANSKYGICYWKSIVILPHVFQTVSTTVRGVKRCSSHPIEQQQWPPFANPYSSFATKHAQIYGSLCRHIAANEHPIYTDTHSDTQKRETHTHIHTPHIHNTLRNPHIHIDTHSEIYILTDRHSHSKSSSPFSELSYTFFYQKRRIGVSPQWGKSFLRVS